MTPDQRADQIAARQHSLLTAADALGAGLSRAQVDHRVGTGRWTVLVRGLYRIRSAPVTEHQRLMAAVLAGPAGTVASHLSAAWLFGLPRPTPHHATVPPGRSARKTQASVHRLPLAGHERARIWGIPVTPPTRTVMDIASLLEAEPLAEVVDAAIVRGITTPARLGAGGRWGAKQLTAALKPWTDPIRPGSPAEVRLLRRLGEWGFPLPVSQYVVRDPDGRFVARVDLGWPVEKVAGEYDGAGCHTPRQLEHDEARRARVEALGWQVECVDRIDLAAGTDRLRRRLIAAFAHQRAA